MSRNLQQGYFISQPVMADVITGWELPADTAQEG